MLSRGKVGAVGAEKTDGDTAWIPPADLSHLGERLKDMVMQVLVEVYTIFDLE